MGRRMDKHHSGDSMSNRQKRKIEKAEKKAERAEKKASRATKKSNAMTTKKTKKKKGFKGWFRGLKKWQKALFVIILILLLVTGVAFGYIYNKLGRIGKISLDKRELSCVDIDGYVNILLLGVDSRDMKDTKGARTDAIMIASIKEETGEVYITSIYRDTFLKMGKDDLYDKVTHAFAYGGPKETIRTINQALDLNIEKFVLFNFKAVADVVDGVGGVTVDVEDYEIPQLNKYTIQSAEIIGKKDYKLVQEPGKQKIEGVQAVSYGRIRQGVGDDYKRTERMRIVLEKVLNKTKKLSVGKIDDLIDTVLPQIKTNLSNKDIISMAMNATKYKVVGSKGFPYEVTGGMLDGVSYVFPLDLEKDVKKLHEEVFKQKDYKPSQKCISISNRIKELSGATPSNTVPIDVDKITENPTEHTEELPEMTPDPNAKPQEKPQEPATPEAPAEQTTPEANPAPGTGGGSQQEGGEAPADGGGTQAPAEGTAPPSGEGSAPAPQPEQAQPAQPAPTDQ